MNYRAPLADIAFTLKHCAGFKPALEAGLYGDLDEDVVDAVIDEAGRFATEVIAPLNAVGDRQGATIRDGVVTTAPGFKEAYQAWAAAGWSGLTGPAAYGGQALPQAINAVCLELWNSASMAFGLCPLLTLGAIEALAAHGTDALKRAYLPKLVAGEWTGTMQLTEPHAGSDVGALRTRAERAADGSYRITGQKIFITYGEHDFTDNIVHLVLARLPDAPSGSRGISMFLVPKFLLDADGRPGPRNDVRAHSIEHKLGIHGSPTCTMVYGDNGGAIGWLIGEENRGLACMFTMMNRARLAVALQGVGIAERATQQALAYARERRQGHAPGAQGEAPSLIIDHPDVRRMLLTMRAKTAAARAIAYHTAVALDHAHYGANAELRATAQERVSLLIPVAKAFATDIGCDVASLGVQVHGGMGYIEETGAAQHLRDARITAIYEGTNGIQAIDLLTRKLALSDGAAVRRLLAELRRSATEATREASLAASGPRLAETIDALERATSWISKDPQSATALAGATDYLRLFALATGGALLIDQALAARRIGDNSASRHVGLARFFIDHVAVAAGGLERAVVEGAPSVLAAADILGD